LRLNSPLSECKGKVANNGNGAQIQLSGPACRRTLYGALLELLSNSDANEKISHSDRRETEFLKGKKVLVAEDNIVNQDVMRMILEEWGCLVEMVENGREAVGAMVSDSFDLVMMDVQMPGMDGLEATRVIRMLEAKKNCHTPIIACTAHAFSRDKEACLSAGMDDFLSKPIDEKKCIDVLHKMFNWGGPVERSLSISEDSCVAPSNESSEQLVDFDRLATCTRSNREFAEKIVGNYLEVAKNVLEKLEKFLQNREWKEIKILAHSLKGSSLNLGANQVARIASELEQISQIKDIDASGRLFSKLTQALQNTAQSFSKYLNKGNWS